MFPALLPAPEGAVNPIWNNAEQRNRASQNRDAHRRKLVLAAYPEFSEFPAITLRVKVLPGRRPFASFSILRDGEPGEPNVALTPKRSHYMHQSEIEVACALTGFLGSDISSFKVSPDGSAFYEALRIDRASSRVEMPEPVVLPALEVVPTPPPIGKLALYARDRAGA